MDFFIAFIIAAVTSIGGNPAVVHSDPAQNEAIHELVDERVHCLIVPNDCY